MGAYDSSLRVFPWPGCDDKLTIDDEVELVLRNGKIVNKVPCVRGMAKTSRTSPRQTRRSGKLKWSVGEEGDCGSQ
ncbi:MAG: hypothetical protein R3C24_14535 [Cyanobacteriota/Melainabacteria group bacterium]